MSDETTAFDAAEYLDTPEAQAEYLSAAFETDDTAYIAKALRTLARAKGMTRVAEEAGITREGLYKALGEKGDPKLSTLLRVAKALGLRISAQAETAPNTDYAADHHLAFDFEAASRLLDTVIGQHRSLLCDFSLWRRTECKSHLLDQGSYLIYRGRPLGKDGRSDYHFGPRPRCQPGNSESWAEHDKKGAEVHRPAVKRASRRASPLV